MIGPRRPKLFYAFPDPAGGWIYRGLRFVFRKLAAAYLRDFDVRGLEQIPRTGGAIIACNHQSFIDGILLIGVCPRPIHLLISNELYQSYFIHWMWRALRCIPVSVTGGPNLKALLSTISVLRHGELVGIFPEGFIYAHHSVLQPFQKGVAWLAMKTGAPVVPTAVHGTLEALPDGALFPKSGSVQLLYHPAVSYHAVATQKADADHRQQEMLDDLSNRIIQMLRHLKATRRRVRRPLVLRAVKAVQIAGAGLLVCPIIALATITSNPRIWQLRQQVKLGKRLKPSGSGKTRCAS